VEWKNLQKLMHHDFWDRETSITFTSSPTFEFDSYLCVFYDSFLSTRFVEYPSVFSSRALHEVGGFIDVIDDA
jgi:hypothetical protein